MKKIVFLRMNPNASGGAERYLERLKNALQNINIKSDLRYYKGNQKLTSWIKSFKFNFQVCKQKKEDEIYFSLERVTSADIYRAGDGVHKVYRRLKRFWFLNPLNFTYVFLEKKCFNNAKKIITNSNMIKNQIIDTYKIDENKITTIYNGINLPKNVQKNLTKISLCKKYNLDNDLPIILFIGSGFKRKGLKEFLNILSHLNIKNNSIVVGKDKRLNFYKSYAKKLNLNTLFIGFSENVNEFYEGSDIFIFPTYYEPFSNVILEAMSYGCVAITTAQNGASEILNKKFIMDNPNDLKISNLLNRLFNDKIYLKKVQDQNIKIASKFSIEKNADLTMETIRAYIC